MARKAKTKEPKQLPTAEEAAEYKRKTLTMSAIKKMSAKTSPHFFDRDTMKFFGQTMKDFHIKHHDGRTFIWARSGANWQGLHHTCREVVMVDADTVELKLVDNETEKQVIHG